MNDISTIYEELWENACKLFQMNSFELDPLIQSDEDRRRGLTLLARLPERLSDSVQSFLEEAKAIEPDQYYQPVSDFHITILSLITCYQGFSMSDFQSDEYKKIIQTCIREISPFKIEFRGITASPSCVMLQGFPLDRQLENLREKLRISFKKSSLHHTIDSRYPIKTAHSTMIRFQKPVRQPSGYLDLLKTYRDWHFGILEVDGLELVFNDWYLKKAHTKCLHRFDLRP